MVPGAYGRSAPKRWRVVTLPTMNSEGLHSKPPAWHGWVSAVVLLFFLPGFLPAATLQKKAQARAEFHKAEELRAELQAKPETKRRPVDYLAVVRHYERVVRLSPTVQEADDSLLAAAQLLAEMGRLFADGQTLERAAEKYRFLIKGYPRSPYLADARRGLKALETARLEFAANSLSEPAAHAPAALLKPASADATAAPQGQAAGAKLAQVTTIRHWTTTNYTRVVIELDGPVEYEAGRISNPDRIFFDLHGARLSPVLRRQSLTGDDVLLKRIRMGQNQVGIARIVLEVGPVREYSAFLLPNPYRLVVDITGEPSRPKPAVASAGPAGSGSAKRTPEPPAGRPEGETIVSSTTAPTSKPVFERVPQPPASQPRETSPKDAPAKETPGKETAVAGATSPPPRAAKPTSSGQRSLIRTLGLKIGKIVIDAGHGGHDTGTIGPTGLAEKDLVMDVAMRLGAMLQDRLGSEIVYTRQDDTFVPLETRTAIANQKQADLFVSIHANSSRDSDARGVETYYLNFTTAQDALEVAARENAVSEKSIYELQDLVKKITLKEKLEESREFAREVQRALVTAMSRNNNGLRNRGVKKAPFVVLIGAQMPSILAEISFVSNPTDERLLRKAEYRQKVAEGLFRGVQRYANSLSGVKVAHSRISE